MAVSASRPALQARSTPRFAVLLRITLIHRQMGRLFDLPNNGGPFALMPAHWSFISPDSGPMEPPQEMETGGTRTPSNSWATPNKSPLSARFLCRRDKWVLLVHHVLVSRFERAMQHDYCQRSLQRPRENGLHLQPGLDLAPVIGEGCMLLPFTPQASSLKQAGPAHAAS